MIEKFEIFDSVLSLFQRFFLKEHEIGKLDLSVVEMDLLEQLLWLTGNISADSQNSRIYALHKKIDKVLSIVVTNFHHILGFNIWRTVFWIGHILSMEISEMEEGFNIDGFNKLVILYLEEAMSTIPSKSPTVEEKKTI